VTKGVELTRVAVAAEGWNAEAAIGFALAARKFTSSVTLSTGSETVDGKDDVDVLSLGPEPGEEVMLTVAGADQKEAFDTLLAELLGVIEPPQDRLATLTKPDTRTRARTASQRRRRTEVVALGGSEAFVCAPTKIIHQKSVTGAFRAVGHRHGRKAEHAGVRRDARPSKDKPSSRRVKNRGHQKGTGKAARRPTPKRKPRKRTK
jgi:phosphotransferase system HPr (HPr) family protein